MKGKNKKLVKRDSICFKVYKMNTTESFNLIGKWQMQYKVSEFQKGMCVS